MKNGAVSAKQLEIQPSTVRGVSKPGNGLGLSIVL